MPKVLSYEALIRGGATIQNKLVVPVVTSDPASPADGQVWVNTTDGVLNFRTSGTTVPLTETTLDEQAVFDLVATAVTAGNNLDVTVNSGARTITLDVEALTTADLSDFTSAVRSLITAGADTTTASVDIVGGAITVDVLDSPKLEGSDKAYFRNVDNHQDGTTNHVFTALDDTKLTGIQAQATKNQTDAFLLSRTNHTDQQPASTISDFASAVAALSINAAELNGMTAAEIQTAVTAAIVDAAPGTLDTLNELAAALGDDPNFATTVTAALNARSRNFTAALTGGAFTEVVTHNLGTRDLVAQVYVASGDYEQEDYIIRHSGLNTITVVSEGVAIPAGRRVVIHAVGN